METISNTKGAVWARVSTVGQEELSLDSQVTRAADLLRSEGHSADYVFKTTWSSEDLHNCPDFLRLQKLVRDRDIGAIAFLNRDRLPANEIHRVMFISDCAASAVRLLPYEGAPVGEGGTGQLVEYIQSFAKRQQVERAQSGARQGLNDRVRRRNLPASGKSPYGYTWNRERSQYIPNDDISNLRVIWKLALSGETQRGIARALTAAGVPAPRGGNAWAKSTIASILQNPVYCGTYVALRTKRTEPVTRRASTYGRSSHAKRPTGEWCTLPGKVEGPVVTQEQFDEVQRRLHANRVTASRNSRHQYLLRGRIVCGLCAAAGHNRKFYGLQPKRGQAVYSCSAHWGAESHSHRCQSVNLPAAAVEADVKRRIRALIEHPSVSLTELEARASDIEYTIAQLERENQRLLQSRRKTVSDETLLVDLLSAGRVSDEAYDLKRDSLARQRETLDMSLTDNSARLEGIRQAASRRNLVEEFAKQVRNRLDDAATEDWAFILDALDVTVVAMGDGTWEVQVTLGSVSSFANCGRNSLVYFSLLTS